MERERGETGVSFQSMAGPVDVVGFSLNRTQSKLLLNGAAARNKARLLVPADIVAWSSNHCAASWGRGGSHDWRREDKEIKKRRAFIQSYHRAHRLAVGGLLAARNGINYREAQSKLTRLSFRLGWQAALTLAQPTRHPTHCRYPTTKNP